MSDKIEELRNVRIQKLEELKKQGIDPYPVHSARTHKIEDALSGFDKLSETKTEVTLAGRIRSIRTHGKLTFGNIEDGTAAIQFLLREDALGEKFKQFNELFDMGDFVEVTGSLALSKTGEKTLETTHYSLLTKSLRPVPQNYFGLKDLEVKLRKRYLDLIANKETRELFQKKAIFWKTIRDFLESKGFMEVEMNVLEQVPGGAEAEPFVTHHNALDRDFYLRISLELPLKRLLVGGYEKVFEIGRIFRNEGISTEHLQDYTQVEFYWAYADSNDLMRFIEKLYKKVIKATMGTMVTTREGVKINWGKKWAKVDYVDYFKKTLKMDPLAATREELFAKARTLHLKPEKNSGKGRLIDLLFKTVRPNRVQPCFLVDPPVEIEPLAKRSRRDPRRVERFQIMASGTELGKGFSELNDPLDQRARFEEQMKLRATGDKEAQMLDEDFLEALEYGMPPAAGFGISERLFAVLMDKSIRETIFFPLMKRKYS